MLMRYCPGCGKPELVRQSEGAIYYCPNCFHFLEIRGDARLIGLLEQKIERQKNPVDPFEWIENKLAEKAFGKEVEA